MVEYFDLEVVEAKGRVPEVLSHGVIDPVASETNTCARAVEAESQVDEGIQTKEVYIEAVLAGNKKVNEVELPEFQANALAYMLYAGREEKPHNTILFTCADGRIDGNTPFNKDPLARFSDRWRPMAGLIFSPKLLAVNNAENPFEAMNQLLSSDEEKESLFDELEVLFGKGIQYQTDLAQATTLAGKAIVLGEPLPVSQISPRVAKIAQKLIRTSADSLNVTDGVLQNKLQSIPFEGFSTTIELQSHGHHEDGGCGAHNCDEKKALQMTAINALVLRTFIESRYPHLVNRINIVRTHHITGENEKVYAAENYDDVNNLSQDIRDALSKDFSPKFLKDPSSGIVREMARESNINTAEHDEYIIRFSYYHRAFEMHGASVLEQVLPPDMDLAMTLVQKLLSIVENNRISRDKAKGKKQPIFLHLDQPMEQDPQTRAQRENYKDFYSRIIQDPQMRSMVEAEELIIVCSETTGYDMTKDVSESLKVTMLPEGF